jgi:hypothetical protein
MGRLRFSARPGTSKTNTRHYETIQILLTECIAVPIAEACQNCRNRGFQCIQHRSFRRCAQCTSKNTACQKPPQMPLVLAEGGNEIIQQAIEAILAIVSLKNGQVDHWAILQLIRLSDEANFDALVMQAQDMPTDLPELGTSFNWSPHNLLNLNTPTPTLAEQSTAGPSNHLASLSNISCDAGWPINTDFDEEFGNIAQYLPAQNTSEPTLDPQMELFIDREALDASEYVMDDAPSDEEDSDGSNDHEETDGEGDRDTDDGVFWN